jgi:uncharacterized protein YjbI with pentapeptide repeats
MSHPESKSIGAQSFTDVRVLGGHKVLEGYEFSRTVFHRCGLAQFDGPPPELVVRNTTARGCKLDKCTAQGVFFDEVEIENLTINPMLHLYGCAFRHVTLCGRIGPLMTVPPHTGLPEATKNLVVAAIVDMYREVDWALDITQAEFSDADFYYVPGDLIKRDPATQFLLRRDSFKGIDVAELPTYANIAARRFESTPFDSIVAVAPKRSKNFERALADLVQLRTAGLAE